jgi:BspA type Leucine rich repeat region (6 copies)
MKETFLQCTNLATIIIPSSVTNIGDNTFDGCSSLTNVTFSTNLSNIGKEAFYSCTALPQITIPQNVFAIGLNAFQWCDKMTSITVNVINPVYRSYDDALLQANCTLIKCPTGKRGRYVVPTGIITLESNAFFNCYNLTNVTVPSSVTAIGYDAFLGCTGMQSIHFGGEPPAGVDNLTFYLDSNLTVYYYPWTTGWGSTFGGRPTQVMPAYTQWLLNNGLATNRTDDAIDHDGDGMLNWQEFLAGTSPTNKADALVITSVGGTNSSQIAWQGKANISYQVMRSLNLLGSWSDAPTGTGTNQQAFQTAPLDGLLQYADPTYVGASNGFYRVSVVP